MGQSDLPALRYDGRKVAPGEVALTKSRCNELPKTRLPCELLDYSKKNSICERCSVRTGGDKINSTRQDRIEMIVRLEEIATMERESAKAHRRGDVCGQNKFWSPKLCPAGHGDLQDGVFMTLRYIYGCLCVECKREQNFAYAHKRMMKK